MTDENHTYFPPEPCERCLDYLCNGACEKQVSNMTDEQIEAIHEQAGEKLNKAIVNLQSELRDAEETVTLLKRALVLLNRNIVAGKWYELKHILTSDEIECLCNCEPTPPVSILDK